MCAEWIASRSHKNQDLRTFSTLDSFFSYERTLYLGLVSSLIFVGGAGSVGKLILCLDGGHAMATNSWIASITNSLAQTYWSWGCLNLVF
jgi:hypothetical protein